MFFIAKWTKMPLTVCGKYIFDKYALYDSFKICETKTVAFLSALEARYLPNPYHNSTHAADVLNSLFYLIKNTSVFEHLTELEIIWSTISSLGHDVGHMALTNRFLITNSHELAIKYNDNSVLESMHSAITFELLIESDKNLFVNLSPDDWSLARKIIIEMILSTDMAKHFELLWNLRAKINSGAEKDYSIPDERLYVLKFMLKCSDIAHAAKKTELHEIWSLKVIEEFFNQGDIEKDIGQPVSMYCDRETTKIAKSQAGFILNLVLPLYEACN
jgi:cAMP-specific phosphodiesterase 4